MIVRLDLTRQQAEDLALYLFMSRQIVNIDGEQKNMIKSITDIISMLSGVLRK